MADAFGVPLNADTESLVGSLDPFDESVVRGMGRNGEATWVEDALVVGRINGYICTHNGMQVSSLDCLDAMLGNIAIPPSMLLVPRGLWEVLVDFSTMDDTHQLHSTTNSE